MPQPILQGPLFGEINAPKGRSGRQMSARDARFLIGESEPGNIADQRVNSAKKRIAAIDAMEAASNAKKQGGKRTRRLSPKLVAERDQLRGTVNSVETSVEAARKKIARNERSSAKRAAQNAAKKAGNNAQKAVAGGTKRAAKTAAPKKAGKKAAAAPKKAATKATSTAKKAGGTAKKAPKKAT